MGKHFKDNKAVSKATGSSGHKGHRLFIGGISLVIIFVLAMFGVFMYNNAHTSANYNDHRGDLSYTPKKKAKKAHHDIGYTYKGSAKAEEDGTKGVAPNSVERKELKNYKNPELGNLNTALTAGLTSQKRQIKNYTLPELVGKPLEYAKYVDSITISEVGDSYQLSVYFNKNFLNLTDKASRDRVAKEVEKMSVRSMKLNGARDKSNCNYNRKTKVYEPDFVEGVMTQFYFGDTMVGQSNDASNRLDPRGVYYQFSWN